MRIHQFRKDLEDRLSYSCQYCGLCLYDVGDFEIRYMEKNMAKCKKGKRLSLLETIKFHWHYYVNCMAED